MLFDRTFHPDEANQAFTTGRLLETGQYTYQPQDHHGPTLYYAAAPLQKAFGHDTTASMDGTLLRCTPLVFAVLALILGFFAVRKLTGRISSGLALPILLGTSPLFVFFATDFIQEMLLAAFTMMMLFSGVNYFMPGKRVKPGTWALVFGIGAGLAFATKETCILTFAATAFAALPFLPRMRASFRLNDLVLAGAGFILTAVLFYSSFGADFHGVYNAFVAAPLSYVNRAAGAATAGGANWHVHPWWQYLEWLFLGKAVVTHEPSFHMGGTMTAHLGTALFPLVTLPILSLCRRFGVPVAPPALRRTTHFVALYTIVLLVLYSAIPYKTPWCALQILLGIAITSVLAIAQLGELCAHRESYHGINPNGRFVNWSLKWMPMLITALACIIVVSDQSRALARIWRDPDSKTIPYNYASASPEARQLAACVADAFAQSNNPTIEQSNNDLIAVALPSEDTWPFPWYNRKLESKTGYWTKFEHLVELEQRGVKPKVVIVPMTEGHLVQPLFPHLKNTKRFYMRPGVRVRVFW